MIPRLTEHGFYSKHRLIRVTSTRQYQVSLIDNHTRVRPDTSNWKSADSVAFVCSTEKKCPTCEATCAFAEWLARSAGKEILRAPYSRTRSVFVSCFSSYLFWRYVVFGIVVTVTLARLLHSIVFNLLHFEVSVGRVAGDRQEDRSSQCGADCYRCGFVSAGTSAQRSARKLGGELVILELERLQLHVSGISRIIFVSVSCRFLLHAQSTKCFASVTSGQSKSSVPLLEAKYAEMMTKDHRQR